MNMRGSDIIVDCLLRHGIDTVFGFPGGAIMPLYDSLYNSPLKHILTVHEQGAVHAADGYARASGRVGVCIATSGPGATNLVTGLATAFMDSSPIIAITGQVSTGLLGRDAFQEIDITGITMPVTKHNFLVRDVALLAGIIHQAFDIAVSGRPGPVLIDVPRDILLARLDEDELPADRIAPLSLAKFDCEPELGAAVCALASAQRPVMIIGGGVIHGGAYQEAIQLAEALSMPVVSTLMGLGVFPSTHPCFLGLTGMHGHKAANNAVCDADVILAVGTRFSDRVTSNPSSFSSGKTVIHLDVDHAEFSKNINADIMIAGTLRHSLQKLCSLLAQESFALSTAWWEQNKQAKTALATVYHDDTFNVPWIMKYMSEAASDQSVIWTTDVGQHQMWAAQHLVLNTPRSWITSGGLGTMGFGLPAALGAQIACRDKRVVAIAGDGGFKMTGMELFTAVNEKLPLICVVINNKSLGMVRQWQQLFFDERYMSTLLPDFDFAGFGRSCGATVFEAATSRQFQAAFRAALSSTGPVVIVANVEQHHLVEPMVSPGSPINEFIDINQDF